MEKNQAIFIATSILMLKDEDCKDVINSTGKESFKKKFTAYHDLLASLYDTSLRKNL